MNRTRVVVTALALLGLGTLGGFPPAAWAQKGVLGTGANPQTGVVDPDGGARYTALPVGQGTAITKLSTEGARVDAYTYLGQRLAVPSVAYDGSPSGLSADGQTLVLAQPGVRFPQRRSEFTVLDTRRLRVLDRLTFAGTYSFDAISPDGRSLFLIEYTSPRDLTEYQVREYSLAQGRFDPEPIIDPNESGEDMYGSPVTRALSPNGRWAYTLYDAKHPFIHALDTKRGTAVCIDLENLHRVVYNFTGLEPSADGSTLTVVDGSRPIEIVDTKTFEVSDPPPPVTPPAAPPPETAGDAGGAFWALIGIGGALVALAGSVVLMRRRRARHVDEDDLARLVRVNEAAGENEDAKEREPVR
jgi:hypothetical protein